MGLEYLLLHHFHPSGPSASTTCAEAGHRRDDEQPRIRGELTGKRHDHVMTDITKMMEELDFHASEFSGTYESDQDNTYSCFSLPRDLTETLITRQSDSNQPQDNHPVT